MFCLDTVLFLQQELYQIQESVLNLRQVYLDPRQCSMSIYLLHLSAWGVGYLIFSTIFITHVYPFQFTVNVSFAPHKTFFFFNLEAKFTLKLSEHNTRTIVDVH